MNLPRLTLIVQLVDCSVGWYKLEIFFTFNSYNYSIETFTIMIEQCARVHLHAMHALPAPLGAQCCKATIPKILKISVWLGVDMIMN